jgi:hypothetical protein
MQRVSQPIDNTYYNRCWQDICIKESKAFDYQMYPGIFVDLSIWQVVLNEGLD